MWIWVALAEQDRPQALEQLRATVEQTQLRQECFVRGFVKENAWHDPVLEQAEFRTLQMDLTGLEA